MKSQKKILLVILTMLIILTSLFSYLFFQKKYLAVPFLKLNGKYAIVDSNTMTPFDDAEFEDCEILSNGFVLCYLNSKYGLYSKEGDKIIDPIFDQIEDFQQGFSVISKDNLKGVINEKGKIIVSPKYEEIKILSEEYFAVKNYNFWGCCNRDGIEIIKPNFEDLINISEGIAVIKKDSKYGCIRIDGELIIPTTYKFISKFCDGRAISHLENGDVYLIDNKGNRIKTITNCDFINDLSDGMYEAVKKNNFMNDWSTRKSALIDSTGFQVSNYDYYSNQSGAPSINNFRNGCATFCKGDYWGVVNKKGKVIVENKYTQLFSLDNIFYVFQKDGQKRLTESEGVQYYDYFGGVEGILENNGRELFTSKFDRVMMGSEGYFGVRLNSKFGFIDKNGKKITSIKYDDIGVFSEGLALVCLNGKWGYIDNNGNEIIKIKFDDDGTIGGEEGSINFVERASFKNGFALVFRDKNKFYIDSKGREFIEEEKNKYTVDYNNINNKTFYGDNSSINFICLSHDNKKLLSGDDDGIVKFWDINSGECLKNYKVSSFGIESLAISPSGNSFLVGSINYEKGSTEPYPIIKLIDYKTEKILQSFVSSEEEGDEPKSSNFSPKGDFIYSAIGTHIKIWDIKTGECIKRSMTHEGVYGITSLSISPNQKNIASSAGNTIKIWDIDTENCIKTLVGHESTVISIAISPDGKYLISGGDDFNIKLWNIETGECLKTFNGHSDRITSLNFINDGKYFISGSNDFSIKLWDISSDSFLREFKGHHGYINSLCSSKSFFISGSADKTIKLWSLEKSSKKL